MVEVAAFYSLYAQLYEALMTKFGEMIPQKMREAGGLEIDCRVCGSDAQADYFFDCLQKMDSEHGH
jgi:hypothetical protein